MGKHTLDMHQLHEGNQIGIGDYLVGDQFFDWFAGMGQFDMNLASLGMHRLPENIEYIETKWVGADIDRMHVERQFSFFARINVSEWVEIAERAGLTKTTTDRLANLEVETFDSEWWDSISE